MSKEPLKDDKVLGLIRSGDKEAWKTLFKNHYKYLCAVSYGVCNDSSVAQDMVQEVFLSIWKNRERLKITSSWQSYLKRSVINRSINHLKSKYQSSTASNWEDYDIRTEASAHQQLEFKELDDALRFGIESLPDRCREIFLLSRFSDLKNKGIATKLNISIKTVENQITKALKLLRIHYVEFQKK